MRLTSYRAAPPRGEGLRREGVLRECRGWRWYRELRLAGPGGDLLFRGLSRSTIGAEGFHGRVRDGIGCLAPRHDHQAKQRPEDRIRDRLEKRVFMRGLSLRATGFRDDRLRDHHARRLLAQSRGPDDCLRNRGAIKPIERLVPVGTGVAALATPAYRRDGLSRPLGVAWF